MKKIVSTLLIGAALAAAVPAVTFAQPYGRGPGPGPSYDPNPGRGYDPYPGPGRGNGYDPNLGRGRGPGWDNDRYPTPRRIAEREANIAQGIDEGERRGGLTRDEAWRLRGQLRDIQHIEDGYRRGGFSDNEIRDLNRRLDVLVSMLDRERRDGDQRGDQISERLTRIEANINEGARRGGLTWQEAARLRADLENLRWRVANARRSGDGLDSRERADLNRRLDQLANEVERQRRDNQSRGRY